MAITKIQIDNSTLNTEADRSTLKTAVSSGATTLTVVSINAFAVNKILLIGEFGSEKSEIVKTHASTAPSGNTVTLASALVHSHDSGTNVYLIDYDQYHLSHSPTVDGSKTALTTPIGGGIINVDPEVSETLYSDSEHVTGFYFIRQKETIGGTFSDYSDAVPLTGFSADTVAYMIERALRETSAELSELLTQSDCISYVNEGVRLVQGKQVRWAEHTNFDATLGQTTRGVNSITLPTDIYDANTNKSILDVRVDGHSLRYLTPGAFENELGGTRSTDVRTEATATNTTLDVDNSYDFEDSGSVSAYVSGTQHTITYSGITRSSSAGVLTGIPATGTGAITVTIPVDTKVWQNEVEGAPSKYTVRNGNLDIYPLPDSLNSNKNVVLDYSTVATVVDSDSDVIDLQRYDMIKDYLTWRIKMKVNNDGNLDVSDGFYQQFKEKLNDAVRTSLTYAKKSGPKLNKMLRRGGFGRRADPKTLPNNQQ